MMPPVPTRTPQRRAADGLTGTEKVVAWTTLALILVEFWCAATGRQLISQAVWSICKKYPFVGPAGGGLAVHLLIDRPQEQAQNRN